MRRWQHAVAAVGPACCCWRLLTPSPVRERPPRKPGKGSSDRYPTRAALPMRRRRLEGHRDGGHPSFPLSLGKTAHRRCQNARHAMALSALPLDKAGAVQATHMCRFADQCARGMCAVAGQAGAWGGGIMASRRWNPAYRARGMLRQVEGKGRQGEDPAWGAGRDAHTTAQHG
jgi:hypothetical protein